MKDGFLRRYKASYIIAKYLPKFIICLGLFLSGLRERTQGKQVAIPDIFFLNLKVKSISDNLPKMRRIVLLSQNIDKACNPILPSLDASPNKIHKSYFCAEILWKLSSLWPSPKRILHHQNEYSVGVRSSRLQS